MTNEKLQKLQGDTFCKHIIAMLKDEKLQNGNPYFLKEDVLMRYATDNNQTFETTALQSNLTGHILSQEYNELEHNGFSITYMLYRRLYYWKGPYPIVQMHKSMYIIQHQTCQQRNRKVDNSTSSYFSVPKALMKFHLRSSAENNYAFTV